MNRRILIILEEGAQAKLLICDHAMDEVNFLSTQVVEAFIGENAVFDLYELEETHNSTVRFNNLYVHQEANSNVLLNGMTLHNGTTRNTTEVTLAGRGAEVNLYGMAIADKNEQVDNNTFIDHQVSDCTSNELFKYVLDDQAVGAFAGKVVPYKFPVLEMGLFILVLFGMELILSVWTIRRQKKQSLIEQMRAME